MAIPTFAAELVYPTFIPDDEYIIYSIYSDYYVLSFNGDRHKVGFKIWNNGNTYAQSTKSTFYFQTNNNDSFSESISLYKYNGTSWDFVNELPVSNSVSGYRYYHTQSGGSWDDYVTILESNVDIYEYDGSSFTDVVVFRPTPPLLEVVAESMENFQVTTVGAMKILLLCGVGLIASLVGLKVFGRVLPIFRV